VAVAVDKTCSACGTAKPLGDFYTYMDKRRGRRRMHPTCKLCSNAKSRAYSAANAEKVSENKRRYYRENIDALKEKGRFARYGVTEEQFVALLEGQGGRCAICFSDDPGRGKDWNVDHDHATGAVRGLLCSKCNLALGGFRDDASLLRSAVAYLMREH
jgi:hypothetical protein